ncbi:ATP-binding response regulator [Ideonella sp. BN130291]|uniref:ATP-binding response regulator n=1 Tax=Ideonella sp. BN130291 TaxID=3112940 RepID=UPI002E260234|nr:hybrid sensor histidine kinase/response regulator [Ideonella sp. BN130291]
MSTSLSAAAVPPATAAAEPASHELDASLDQVRALHVQTPASLAGNLIGLTLIAAMFFKLAPAATVAWCLMLLAVWAVRWVHYRRYPAEGDLQALLRWRGQWNVLTLASGVCWGTAVWLFYGRGATFHTIGLILIVYSYCLGSVQLLARQWRIYLTFISLGLVPTIARIATDTDQPYHWQLAFILTLLFLVTAIMGRTYRQAFERTIELKQRTEQLLAQLRVEKAAAEAARRDAEVANRAKTQFFAAASHDLRQPLHALGLFAEALRSRNQDEQVTHLVNSINSSVDALEGLFSELLDITKIDTGGVEPVPQHFALADVFRKLKLHFEPTAFEKGLDLRFRGAAHHAFADPVLVERVLRNLVSNAIRYTNDGSVLVSARQRGDTLLLQVWDTGVGIREREQERIFEEFYQVPDQAVALDPHQRKGLGLGLAIVKRLAALMQAPLRLRSRPGHGTVFSMEVPIGRAQPTAETSIKGKPALGLTLDHRLIVIVEDDAAVRSGLEVLLKGWGASVLSFESVAACVAWGQIADPANPAPDLIIADYRLESGHTGVEAITMLRQRFGEGLPAIVVTGSLMTGHEREAQNHNFHLLVKPVVPNKLRAMIAFKLGVR